MEDLFAVHSVASPVDLLLAIRYHHLYTVVDSVLSSRSPTAGLMLYFSFCVSNSVHPPLDGSHFQLDAFIIPPLARHLLVPRCGKKEEASTRPLPF